MQNFSFTIAEGSGLAYVVAAGTNISAATLVFQFRRLRTDAWATSALVTLTKPSTTTVGLTVSAANANATLAPSFYRITADGTSIIEGRIGLATTSTGETGGVTGSGITSIVKLTQAEYDAITTKSDTTLYVIV